MISGKIEMYEEKKPTFHSGNGYVPWYNGDDWDSYRSTMASASRPKTSQERIAEQIEEEIELACTRGFYIGSAVRRKKGVDQSIGIIKHFVRDPFKAYNHFEKQADVIAVQWTDWVGTHNYNTEDLDLVKGPIDVPVY